MDKQMTVRIPKNLKSSLKKIADKKGFTLNGLILQILWDWVEEKEK